MVSKDRIHSILNRLIEYFLYILIFSLPFSITIVEVCATIAIVFWIFKKLVLEKERFKLPHTDLNLPLVIFYFISFLSIFWSTHPDISMKAFILKLTEYLLLYFIVFESVSERRVVRNLIRILAVSAFITGLDAIYQKFTGYDFIRGYPFFSLLQVTGPFKFPNGLGAYLLIVSPPFISLALFYPVRKRFSNGVHKKDLKLKIANSFLAVLLTYCLFLTLNRGTIISFIIAVGLIFLLKGGRVYYAACAVLIIGIAVMALTLPEKIKYYVGLSELFSGLTSQHRLRMWTVGWKMFMARPLLGQGLNTFMANYARFRLPEETGIWYAHNCYLQMAAETGIFGLLSFLWVVVRMAIASLRSWKFIKDEFLRYVYLGLFCGIVAFLIHSSVDTLLYSLRLVVLFYFSLGLLMGIKNIGLNHGKV